MSSPSREALGAAEQMVMTNKRLASTMDRHFSSAGIGFSPPECYERQMAERRSILDMFATALDAYAEKAVAAAEQKWREGAGPAQAIAIAAGAAEAVARERGECIKDACPYCAGKMASYSSKPKVTRDNSLLMHLAQGLPPRVCTAAAIIARGEGGGD